MTIICSLKTDSNRNNTGMTFAFHKNGHVVQEFGSNNTYHISSPTPKDSGNYTCDVKTQFSATRKTTKHVKVQELFSDPELKVNHYPVAEGANVTITCSSYSSYSSAVLQFAFHRNGKHVKEFGSSEKYRIDNIHRNDSGNYTCEVRTRDDKVKKMSQMLSIHVQGKSVLKNIISLFFNGNCGRLIMKVMEA
ncbi:Fc receptor-like protein 2 [Xenopus laevis]|uniref:Fc receptor-like protein 2 n=1 Tax=Xenopus laevis TaxID=8355 RepID=A0A8J1LK65_XENLA|nr:Fc receptor-like protein 2 [Xenopus laevis]